MDKHQSKNAIKFQVLNNLSISTTLFPRSFSLLFAKSKMIETINFSGHSFFL